MGRCFWKSGLVQTLIIFFFFLNKFIYKLEIQLCERKKKSKFGFFFFFYLIGLSIIGMAVMIEYLLHQLFMVKNHAGWIAEWDSDPLKFFKFDIFKF